MKHIKRFLIGFSLMGGLVLLGLGIQECHWVRVFVLTAGAVGICYVIGHILTGSPRKHIT